MSTAVASGTTEFMFDVGQPATQPECATAQAPCGPRASTEETNLFERALRLCLEQKNPKWHEYWTKQHEPSINQPGELNKRYQTPGPLVKWVIAEQKLDASYTYE